MKKENTEKDSNKKVKPILTEEELKKRKVKKTRVAAASFVLILGLGILGNWYFENANVSDVIQPLISTGEKTKNLGEAEYVDATTQQNDNSKESEYFSTARLERQNARDEALDKLQSVLEKTDESEKARKKAADEIARLSSNISAENKIETLISAKGVDNCLAVISENGDRVDIIVDSNDLEDALVMQIKDIAMQQIGCSYKDVTIIQSS
ncbi:MAG: SpoIIIAH-like family protein [Eubacterium sp.]|nr:SpoIIIAH-like family protein [Eubacterium sp.]